MTAGLSAIGAIHATAVAIGGRALVIRGPSGSGKSALACALIAASTPRRRVELVGDDRVILTWADGALSTRPHPRIAGFLERRGLGLVAMAYVARAPALGWVDLAPATTPMLETYNLPALHLFDVRDTRRRRTLVHEWYEALVVDAA